MRRDDFAANLFIVVANVRNIQRCVCFCSFSIQCICMQWATQGIALLASSIFVRSVLFFSECRLPELHISEASLRLLWSQIQSLCFSRMKLSFHSRSAYSFTITACPQDCRATLSRANELALIVPHSSLTRVPVWLRWIKWM
jgi:hypothetical protein